jgi:hypothetical protein
MQRQRIPAHQAPCREMSCGWIITHTRQLTLAKKSPLASTTIKARSSSPVSMDGLLPDRYARTGLDGCTHQLGKSPDQITSAAAVFCQCRSQISQLGSGVCVAAPTNFISYKMNDMVKF